MGIEFDVCLYCETNYAGFYNQNQKEVEHLARFFLGTTRKIHVNNAIGIERFTVLEFLEKIDGLRRENTFIDSVGVFFEHIYNTIVKLEKIGDKSCVYYVEMSWA